MLNRQVYKEYKAVIIDKTHTAEDTECLLVNINRGRLECNFKVKEVNNIARKERKGRWQRKKQERKER